MKLSNLLKIEKNIKKNKAFTLVELIVVITILAILGTIAFISYQGYSKDSRDSKRIADINSIQKSLELFITEKGFYPNPDDGTSITYIGALAWTQGTIGDTVIRNIGKINEKPVDPLTDTEYTYSVANNKKEYQIGFIKEGGLIGLNLPLPQTYAAEKTAIAVIKGNYNEKIIKVLSSGINYILAVPTIINANLKNTDLQTIINNQELVYNNYKNLPDSYKNLGYTMTGSFNYNPTNIVIYSGATIDLTEESEKVVFMTNLQNAYKGTVIQSEDAYQDIININPANTGSVVKLVNNYLTTNVGGITGKAGTVSYRTCTLDGQTIIHNQTITAYTGTTIPFATTYECTDIAQERTCNDGTLSGDSVYQYLDCIKGTATNCTANSNYETTTNHTYSIPAINHGQTATNITSSNVSENYGIFTYTLTSIGCNDGSLTNEIESGTPTLVNCDSGFTPNGNACVPSTYTVSGGFGVNANGATINVCGTNVTADSSGNFTTTRNYGAVCNTITATRTGYTCSTTTNGPASLVSNTTNIAGSCTLNTYTVSGSFGANANGATINVCGTNVTATSTGTFTTTRNYGTVCNTITATRTGYTCNTTINGPASLISNTTNIAGNCTINTYTVSGGFGANANGATINVCGTTTTADSSGNFTTTRNYGDVCNAITSTRTGYACITLTNGPSSLTSNITNIAGGCSLNISASMAVTAYNQFKTDTGYWTMEKWYDGAYTITTVFTAGKICEGLYCYTDSSGWLIGSGNFACKAWGYKGALSGTEGVTPANTGYHIASDDLRTTGQYLDQIVGIPTKNLNTVTCVK